MSTDFLSDIIIKTIKDIELIKINPCTCELLYLNITLTKLQLKQLCNILQPKHIIFRLQFNKLQKLKSDRVVFTMQVPESSITEDNTIIPSSVNKITFYWDRNRPLTKNVFPQWIYEMYNNIFNNTIIDSLNNLHIINKPIQKQRTKTNRTFTL
jgi:hypothetical protein